MMRSVRPESSQQLRLAIIQHKGDSAEAKVVATLLASMQAEPQKEAVPRVLVIQFGRERLRYGDALRDIPNVEVLSLDIGGSLGVAQPWWRALVYLGRLLLLIPGMLVRVWRFGPTVVYTSQQRWDVRLAMIFTLLRRTPHVVHLHYTPGPWLGREVLWSLKRCQHVICVSDFIRGLAIETGVPANRCTTIRNVLSRRSIGTSLTRVQARAVLCERLRISQSEVLVGMVARVDRGKGQLELVQAMGPILSAPHGHCQLVLIGPETYPEQGYANEVQRAAENLGVPHRVHWLGNRKDVPDILRALDVFAHPSYNEPCPLSVIEALLAGVPCVGWQDGGQAELIVDQRSGLLAKTGDVESLRAAIELLCEHPEIRARMSAGTVADAVRLSDTSGAALAFRKVLEDGSSHSRSMTSVG